MRWLAILALAACAQKKPPEQPKQQQQGSAAPTVSDPTVDQRGADDGRPTDDPTPQPLGRTQSP